MLVLAGMIRNTAITSIAIGAGPLRTAGAALPAQALRRIKADKCEHLNWLFTTAMATSPLINHCEENKWRGESKQAAQASSQACCAVTDGPRGSESLEQPFCCRRLRFRRRRKRDRQKPLLRAAFYSATKECTAKGGLRLAAHPAFNRHNDRGMICHAENLRPLIAILAVGRHLTRIGLVCIVLPRYMPSRYAAFRLKQPANA